MSRGLTQIQIDTWFTYHRPDEAQQRAYVALRDKARELATLYRELCPGCADQMAAVRLLRESVMTANAAIACQGAAE